MNTASHFNKKQFLMPYVIAEIGVNHECCMDTAKRLIEEAAEGGAHAAKFQVYTAERIASKHSPAYWDQTKESASSQFELFKRYDLFGEKEYEELARHCQKNNIDFLATPFDIYAVEFLDHLMDVYKIASADIANIQLLRAVASKNKPVLLSTGAALLSEIAFAVETLQAAGAGEITLLHCVLQYPTPEDHAQLQQIAVLKKRFPEFSIGYSDHVPPGTNGMPALDMATLLGAVVIEKHFTHDKTLPGNDHYHAMNKEDLAVFMQANKQRLAMYGSEIKQLDLESAARKHARRSIVAATNIAKGERFTEKNLTVKRPGHGISPIHWDELLQCKAQNDISGDALISWKDCAEVVGNE
ncbi:N-acetylneuraminate synthase family protein [Desulfovibrio mangrovi]|uniref:N-acetylneuraminate synthase family protein n=1 Tax=Desulfovibrio mangrovi TaxID=2976983 RepID=UPI0022473061|nr:N-acetylneuraminate synthase family protein [Desulfovibrio mangrovi]UZP66664.1 N-acetylneuraminate synthase family protein [Desulfovibrio mangrovi]